MADAVPLILMVLALVALMIGRALLIACREHVRRVHPDWFAELGGAGPGVRLGGPAERARRKLLWPLLFGKLPGAAGEDAMLKRMAEHLKLSLMTAGLSLAGLVIILTIRAQAAG